MWQLEKENYHDSATLTQRSAELHQDFKDLNAQLARRQEEVYSYTLYLYMTA